MTPEIPADLTESVAVAVVDDDCCCWLLSLLLFLHLLLLLSPVLVPDGRPLVPPGLMDKIRSSNITVYHTMSYYIIGIYNINQFYAYETYRCKQSSTNKPASQFPWFRICPRNYLTNLTILRQDAWIRGSFCNPWRLTNGPGPWKGLVLSLKCLKQSEPECGGQTMPFGALISECWSCP